MQYKFVYYELYNVKLENGTGDFEQKLTLKKNDDRPGLSKAVNSVLNIFGAGSDDKEIILTTNYKVTENNPQIFFQIDMNNYEQGEYLLIIDIKDNKTNETVRERTILTWE